MAAIEGPQAGGAGDLAGLRLEVAMQKLGVPGASIAVIEDFAITGTRGYGVASSARTTPDTLFQAASITIGGTPSINRCAAELAATVMAFHLQSP